MWLNIFQQVMTPMFITIAIGYLFQKKFELELKTLSTLLVYLFIPSIVFYKIYEADISGRLVALTLIFTLIQFVVLWALSELLANRLGLRKEMKGSFVNSIVLMNSGNYGLPVNQLAFQGNEISLSIQVIVILFQNFVTFSFGLFQAERSQGLKKALLKYFKLPIFYAMLLAVIMKSMSIDMPNSIDVTLQPFVQGFTAIALFSLGAQLFAATGKARWGHLVMSNSLRLVIAPTVAFAILKCFGLSGIVAQALLVSTAFPTSRNSAMISMENEGSGFASQVVLTSSILSMITVPIVIQIGRIYF